MATSSSEGVLPALNEYELHFQAVFTRPIRPIAELNPLDSLEAGKRAIEVLRQRFAETGAQVTVSDDGTSLRVKTRQKTQITAVVRRRQPG